MNAMAVAQANFLVSHMIDDLTARSDGLQNAADDFPGQS
jgi:hypothetical protein